MKRKRAAPTATVGKLGKGISVILIGRYNDRGCVVVAWRTEGTEEGVENKGKSGAGLRTSRLPRICYEPIAIVSPYLLASLRQCLVGCTVWLGGGNGAPCECVCDAYLLARLPMCSQREREYVCGLM